MAYHYTIITVGEFAKPEKLYCGEPGDRCYICNESLAGKDCFLFEQDNFLVCANENNCMEAVKIADDQVQ